MEALPFHILDARVHQQQVADGQLIEATSRDLGDILDHRIIHGPDAAVRYGCTDQG